MGTYFFFSGSSGQKHVPQPKNPWMDLDPAGYDGMVFVCVCVLGEFLDALHI